MNKLTGIIVASAVSLMFAGKAKAEGDKAPAKKGGVACTENNACKGQGTCKGANHECAGKNECKGQGKQWDAKNAKECKKKKGTPAA